MLLWFGDATALTSDGTIRDLRHTGWGTDEGAPAAATALAQTSDGYLWIGNSDGLFGFDGLRFEHLDVKTEYGLESDNIISLFAPEGGGLWLGLGFGGAALLNDAKMTAFGEKDGLSGGTVMAITQDQDGGISGREPAPMRTCAARSNA